MWPFSMKPKICAPKQPPISTYLTPAKALCDAPWRDLQYRASDADALEARWQAYRRDWDEYERICGLFDVKPEPWPRSHELEAADVIRRERASAEEAARKAEEKRDEWRAEMDKHFSAAAHRNAQQQDWGRQAELANVVFSKQREAALRASAHIEAGAKEQKDG